jgi:DNA-binding NarL/FixJ family response regulator
MKIKVSLVDDHPIVSEGFRKMFEDVPDMMMLDTFPDIDSMWAGLNNQAPDVLLLDIHMPGKGGDEAMPVLHKKYPDLKVIALTNSDSTLYAQYMLRNGAQGYLLKTVDKQTLFDAIRAVYEGSIYILDTIKNRIEHLDERQKKEVSLKTYLTPRELEILQCIVNGDSSPEIAEKLFLTIRTVDNYRYNILLKMDAKNTAILVRKAIESGIVL